MRTMSKGLLVGWVAILAAGPSLSAEPNVLREVRVEGPQEPHVARFDAAPELHLLPSGQQFLQLVLSRHQFIVRLGARVAQGLKLGLDLLGR